MFINKNNKKMKNYYIILICLHLILVVSSCKQKTTNSDNEQIGDTVQQTTQEAFIPDTRTFYEVDKNQSIDIANPITYDVIIKNPDSADEWTTECLKDTKAEILINILFQAVYKNRLIAYDYMSNEPMTTDQVKEFEKEYTRDKIGKIQFVEEWYFNEETLEMGKKIKEVTIGYELYGNQGEVRAYKAGFKLYLSDSLKNNLKNL